MKLGFRLRLRLKAVRKLENAEYIKSYHALVDEEKLGLGIKTFIQISLDFHQKNTIQTFLDEIKTLKKLPNATT
jgi:Lrp/AsnC family leucine-responsive transcriptional regulator